MWIAIATGALTALATIYGLFREWQNYRQNQASRLSNAASIAVRRAEANVVRPLLRERMAATINRFLQNHGACDPLCFRTLLFRDLNTHMVLTDEEKALAHTAATNNLISMLRAMPGPPVHLLTDAQVKRHSGLLHGARRHASAAWRPQQVENAYSLRGRPTVDMLQQLALFWGSSAVPVVATT